MVLVTYATKYGSTKEIAERIAERLRSIGEKVDILPVREVATLDGYDGVVLGAPPYVGNFLKDAGEFMRRRQEELQRMPVAVFAPGPLKQEELANDDQLPKALGKVPWLKPVSAQVFVGKYDPEHLRGLDKLVPKVKASPLYGVPMMDNRDWDAIDAWADGLPEKLGTKATV